MRYLIHCEDMSCYYLCSEIAMQIHDAIIIFLSSWLCLYCYIAFAMKGQLGNTLFYSIIYFVYVYICYLMNQLVRILTIIHIYVEIKYAKL